MSSSTSSSAISAAACANADCCALKADRVVILYCSCCWPNARLLRCGVTGPMPLPNTAFCCCGCYCCCSSYCSYFDRNNHI